MKIRSSWLALFFMAAVAGSALAAPIPDKPIVRPKTPTKERPQEVLDAIDAFGAGKVDGAYEILVKAAKKHPHLPPPRVMLANLYLSDNQLAPGRSMLERAAVEHPDDPEPLISFAELAAREGRLTEAAALLGLATEKLKAPALDATRKKQLQGRYYSAMASVAEGRGQWAKAGEWLTALAGLQPENAGPRQRIGAVLFAQGKVDDAYKQFAAAEKLDQSQPPAALAVAGMFRQQSKLDDAAKWLERAANELPKDIRPQIALARFYMDSGELAQAEVHAEAAEKLDPNALEVRVLRGIVARFRGQFAKAEEYLSAVHEIAPGNLTASNHLALAWADQSDPAKLKKALELATASVKTDPRNLELASTLGWIYFLAGNDQEAARALQQAASSRAISRDTAYYMARVFHKQGNSNDAIKMLQGALANKGPFTYMAAAQEWGRQIGVKVQ